MGCKSSSPVNQQKPNTKSLSLPALRADVLRAYNLERRKHGKHPIQINEELNRIAQNWADHLATSKTFDHSPLEHRKGAGENLAGHFDLIGGEDLVKMWTMDHTHSLFGERQGIAHLTYDIGESCTHIGLGRSRDTGIEGMYIYVCNYLPGSDWLVDMSQSSSPMRR